MAICLEDTFARIAGEASVEEALDFSAWLIAHPGAPVDLAAAGRVHSAVVQCLLALRPPLSAPPPDPFLALCLAGLPLASLPVSGPPAAEPVSETPAL